jgi:hypothetical protein
VKTIDFNRSNLALAAINHEINELIERAEPASENYRQYLGASAIGTECLRKLQYDWMCDPVFPARIKDIFARGHFFEELTRQHLIAAGFKFAPSERLKFKTADGLFRGMLMESSRSDRYRHWNIRPCGSTSASRKKAGARSSATVWLGSMRPMPDKSRSIRLIWM